MKVVRKAIVLLSLVILVGFSKKISAETNMNGGGSGGGTQAGTSQNYYVAGDDGVRITVLDTSTKCRANGTKTFDYYRLDDGKDEKNIYHFGKVCKLEYIGAGGYKEGRSLVRITQSYSVDSSGQTVAFHKSNLPTIVSNASSTSSIEQIKQYFNNEEVLRGIAKKAGIAYDEMINGKYKILIEPMIYLTFQGKYFALTAHEAAKLDIALGGTLTSGGDLRAKFVSFTHKNLPLSIFLKKKDLGIKPWTGSKYSRVQNGSILTYLGIGILSFVPQGNDVELDGGRYAYRPDTEVITSVDVSVTDGDPDGASCDNPITVRFEGEYIATIYVTGVTMPQGGNRPVWIKWRTPDTKECIKTTITATITKGGTENESVTIPIVIKPLARKEPENPTADDIKPRSWTGTESAKFPTTSVLAGFSSPVTSRSWNTYTCTKRYEIDYYDRYLVDGEWVERPVYKTVYDYSKNTYSAKLNSTTVNVSCDHNTKNANAKKDEIKSGYGIEVKVKSNVSGSNCTGMQSFCCYFPEFGYKKYRRDGVTPGASLLDAIELPVNAYSVKKNRVHFTPIWFLDKEYQVYVETFDCWTPAGMLVGTGKGSIQIKGSMWDNWHIQTVKG